MRVEMRQVESKYLPDADKQPCGPRTQTASGDSKRTLRMVQRQRELLRSEAMSVRASEALFGQR
jgi:hypothetical protein